MKIGETNGRFKLLIEFASLTNKNRQPKRSAVIFKIMPNAYPR